MSAPPKFGQLERLGARMPAVEAHALAFQPDLIVENPYGLSTRFRHGDFVTYLEAPDAQLDIVSPRACLPT